MFSTVALLTVVHLKTTLVSKEKMKSFREEQKEQRVYDRLSLIMVCIKMWKILLLLMASEMNRKWLL